MSHRGIVVGLDDSRSAQSVAVPAALQPASDASAQATFQPIAN
jgi:hypothetical protein